MEKNKSGYYENDYDDIKNINYYVDIGPTLYSWILPVEDRREIDERLKMNFDNGKAKDVDMGFRNNGLQ